MIKLIVGNKIDLKDREKVQIKTVLDYASKINASYFRTSAKLDEGVETAFYEIAR